MDRRTFLISSGTLFGIAGAVAFLESCKKNNTTQTTPTSQGPSVNFTIDLSIPANSSLNTSGNSSAKQGVVVVNTNGAFVAVAQACTHQGCNVSYSKSGNNFVCPCHNGTFDVNGSVTGGPPPAPLKKYTVSKSGSILTISG